MTLISLLLVLLVERVTTKSQYWQAEFYTNKYTQKIQSSNWLNSSSKSWVLILIILLPVFIIYLLVQEFTGGLAELIISTAILMVCVGCPNVRATYKCFLQAAQRDDMQACNMYEQQLSDKQDGASFGQNLVWQNYRHYTAIILWFAIFGAAGAIGYVLIRDIEYTLRSEDQTTGNNAVAKQAKFVLGIVDWLPVRITAFGFLLIGHFSRAFPTWLGYLPDPTVAAKTLLLDVSKKAEEIEPDESNCTEEPCTLVRLAKRNVMFLLVIIAILTLSGWIN